MNVESLFGIFGGSEGDSSSVVLADPVLIACRGGGKAVTFVRSSDPHVFTGPPGSAADGVSVVCSIAERAYGSVLTATVITDTRLEDLQIVLPFDIDLSWRSYLIAPGAMYGGNRFVVSPQPYCPYLLTEGVGPDGPIVIADVPRLSSDTAYHTELAANALSVPVIGIYDRQRETGVLIGPEVFGDWGVSGVNITTMPCEQIRVELTLPVMRKRRYRFCDWTDADEQGMELVPGKPIRFTARIIMSAVPSIPDFIAGIAEYAHEMRGTEPRRPIMALPAAAEFVERKHDEYNWRADLGYYKTGLGDSPNSMLQVGWVGGGPTFAAMCMSPNPERRRRGVVMMDLICREGISPSGYFHGMHDGKRWQSFGVKRPGCTAYSLIRRSLECTRDILKVFDILRSRGERVDGAWESAAKSNLDAMVDTTARFGHLGYTVSRDNGDVLWGDSTCGAFGIEPLVRGAARFDRSEYLLAAARLAEYYASHFIAKGFTCGGVGDALMAPDSESCWALTAGLVHLHTATGDPEHLRWARQAADLFSTWVLCYDARLPDGSPLAGIGIQPRGAVFANIQNQHGAPGICTASGRELLVLYESTGEERYLRLLEDIAGCLPQMIVRPETQYVWPSLPEGSITERLMTMDGMLPAGQTASISTWSEIALLLTARELPAEYRSADGLTTAKFDACGTE